MPKTTKESKARWAHNAFFGHVAMDTQHMLAIMKSETTTPEAQAIASRISHDLGKLKIALKTRVDNYKGDQKIT